MRALKDAGDEVFVTTRDKDVTIALLDVLHIQHVCISRMGAGISRKAWELLRRGVSRLRIARRFHPDVMVARTGISAAPVGALLRIPSVIFEDTEHSRLEMSISLPFATFICTGTGYLKDHGRRQVRFRGFPVLAYMAPQYFHPDAQAIRSAGVDPDRPYIVVRKISWEAVHDIGLSGAGENDMLGVVESLSRFGRVLISSETPLPETLERYRNPVPVEHMHDLLAGARLYVGEGGTMAAEAAVLGTPSIFCSSLRTGYLLSMERDYGLVRNTDSMTEGLALAKEMLRQEKLSQVWQERRDKMLEDSEDVVKFMSRIIRRAGSGS